jgi:hypothetical protein
MQQLLAGIRESEQSQEGGVDESTVQNQKNEVLKKIVTRAQVLNGAPERGMKTPVLSFRKETDLTRSLQSLPQHTTFSSLSPASPPLATKSSQDFAPTSPSTLSLPPPSTAQASPCRP